VKLLVAAFVFFSCWHNLAVGELSMQDVADIVIDHETVAVHLLLSLPHTQRVFN